MLRSGRIAYRVGLGSAVSLLVALTVGVLTVLTYVNTRNEVLKLTRERVDELLHGLSTRIESYMLRAVPAVELSRAMAASSPKQPDSNLDQLARHFLSIMQANPDFNWASWSDQNGQFTGTYRTMAGDMGVSQTVLHSGKLESREYKLDQSGNWTRASPGAVYDPREEAWFRMAVTQRKRVWDGPYIFYDEGIPGVTCASPLVASDGQVRGVFTIDFDLQELSQFVTELRFGDSGHVFLLTPDNHVVAHPKLKLARVTGQGAKGQIPVVSDVSDPLLQAFVKARPTSASKSPEMQFSFQFDGREYIAAQRAVNIDDSLPLVLGALAPADDFVWVVERNRDLSVIIACVGVAAGVYLAMLLARRITSPLTGIADEMHEVASLRLEDRPAQKTLFREVAMMDAALLGMKSGLRSFARYVPTGLVRSVLESGQEAKLAGETRQMTVYFSDIQDFTGKAEGLRPQELVSNLSDYLEEMTRLITASSGTVDKFIGDAIMAFWGAPAPTEDHAIRACETALRSQRRLAELRASAQKPWLANLHSRIGVATGEMLVGNVGTADRFNYTVMGDTVNIASRLESLGKQYGTEILVSETTFEAAKSHVVGRPVDLVQVKGKHYGIVVYELLCLQSEAGTETLRFAEACGKAFDRYRSREFPEAVRCFDEALTLRPNDRAATILRERSLAYTQSPPPPDWNGTFVAVAK